MNRYHTINTAPSISRIIEAPADEKRNVAWFEAWNLSSFLWSTGERRDLMNYLSEQAENLTRKIEVPK